MKKPNANYTLMALLVDTMKKLAIASLVI